MEDIKKPNEKDTEKKDVILNETDDDILESVDTMSVGDLMYGYTDNMPDDEIDSEIKLFTKLGKYLGEKDYDKIRVFVDTEGEYEPSSYSFAKKDTSAKTGKDGFEKYAIDDMKIAKDTRNGNTFLYFANDEDFEKYVEKVKEENKQYEGLELKTEAKDSDKNTRTYLNCDKTEDIGGHKRCSIDLVPGTKSNKKFDSKTHKITTESVYEYDENSEDDQTLYDELMFSELGRFLEKFGANPEVVTQYDRSDRVIKDLIYMIKASRRDREFESKTHKMATESVDDEKYSVYSYYGRDYRGLEDSLETNDWSEIEEFAHEHLMKGGYVEIIGPDMNERLDPDEYIETFDGEFPIKPVSVTYNNIMRNPRTRRYFEPATTESLELQTESVDDDSKDKIEVGMIVRYAPEWCSPGEHKYLHVVKENRLNPVTNEMTRWLIQTINSKLSFAPTEVVDEEMIEPTGFSIFDFESPEEAVVEIETPTTESLELQTEKIVKKKNGKYTNRGKSGKEHGEFKTKKGARKQQKAMFANGYKGEALELKTEGADRTGRSDIKLVQILKSRLKDKYNNDLQQMIDSGDYIEWSYDKMNEFTHGNFSEFKDYMEESRDNTVFYDLNSNQIVNPDTYEPPREKIVIYNRLGDYYTTPLSNYNSRISNARKDHRMNGFTSPDEIMDYYIKYGWADSRDDFIVIDDTAKSVGEALELKVESITDPEEPVEELTSDTDKKIADTVLKNVNDDNELSIKFDLVEFKNEDDAYTMDIMSKDKVYFYTATTVSDSKLIDDYITSLTDNLKHQISVDALTGNEETIKQEEKETPKEKVEESLKEGLDDGEIDRLVKALQEKFDEVALSKSWGFETIQDVRDYLGPVIEYDTVTDNPEFNYRIEVRMESPTFDAQMEMSQELDEVLASMGYADSYFDSVTYGIIETYVKVNE